MGVVVSAVASGIVQNVQADLVKAQEGKEGKEETHVVQGRLQEGRESPGRIETPGYPPVLLPPPPPPAPTFTDLTASLTNTNSQELSHSQGKDVTEKRMPEENEVQEQEEKEEHNVVKEVEAENCKSPSFLENIFSTLRLTSPSQPQPLSLPEPELEPGQEPGEKLGEKKVVVVEPVGFFPAESLPVVSLLPTLTEEITISLSQSHHSNAGWFRRNYTSIDTVQKIYGTHPRYGQRRGGGGLARPRR